MFVCTTLFIPNADITISSQITHIKKLTFYCRVLLYPVHITERRGSGPLVCDEQKKQRVAKNSGKAVSEMNTLAYQQIYV